MYASTKIMAIVLSSTVSRSDGFDMERLVGVIVGQRDGFYLLWMAIGIDFSCFFMVLQCLHFAMSGEQGNAVVLPLMNAAQALFAIASGAMVFFDVAPWLAVESACLMIPGVLFIISGMALAFCTDATRTYVALPDDRGMYESDNEGGRTIIFDESWRRSAPASALLWCEIRNRRSNCTV